MQLEKLKLEKLQFENRSVENDLRAQISEQQREIKRLKLVDDEKEKKLEKMNGQIENMKIEFEKAKEDKIKEAKNVENNDLSQNEIVSLFENCIITPDSNRFHTKADVRPFLKALQAGIDNLKFRLNLISPFKKEKGWNVDQHFFCGPDSKWNRVYIPKIIHEKNGKRVIFGDYALWFCIVHNKNDKILVIDFHLFSPVNIKLKITALTEAEGYLNTKNSTYEDNYEGKKYNNFGTWLKFPQSHSFYNGASIAVTYSVTREN